MAYVKMQPYIWIPSAPKIYGAEWAGTSDPAWTRTDDAVGLSDPNPTVNNGNGNSPFDTIYPWKDMKRVEDSAAGTLVEIPKFYYKWIRSGAKMKLLITDSFSDGFFVSPAHADRNDGKGERNVVYVGAYHCATSTYKSTTGVKPQTRLTIPTFRSNIHNLGSNIWQYDYAMYWTIMMLYLVEYANWNTQSTIGYGCGNGSSVVNTGFCDAMVYHTGTNAASRTTYGHIRYRYIEDLWSNVYDWCDGIYFAETNIYCIKNPVNFSDSSKGVYVGRRSSAAGFISAWTNPQINGFEYAIYPNATNGSGSTYVCDNNSYFRGGSTNLVYVAIGATFYQGLNYGGFALWGGNTDGTQNERIGSRLMKLP